MTSLSEGRFVYKFSSQRNKKIKVIKNDRILIFGQKFNELKKMDGDGELAVQIN